MCVVAATVQTPRNGMKFLRCICICATGRAEAQHPLVHLQRDVTCFLHCPAPFPVRARGFDRICLITVSRVGHLHAVDAAGPFWVVVGIWAVRRSSVWWEMRICLFMVWISFALSSSRWVGDFLDSVELSLVENSSPFVCYSSFLPFC